jgi:hypothetical protein
MHELPVYGVLGNWASDYGSSRKSGFRQEVFSETKKTQDESKRGGHSPAPLALLKGGCQVSSQPALMQLALDRALPVRAQPPNGSFAEASHPTSVRPKRVDWIIIVLAPQQNRPLS